MPSHASQKDAQSHMVLDVTDNLKYPSPNINSSITVGLVSLVNLVKQ